jgi:(2Fe-2S) ferredoxin
MKLIAARHLVAGLISVTTVLFTTHAALGADPGRTAAPRRAAPAATVKTFDNPQQAAAALIAAAGQYDVPALEQLFGPLTKSVILSSEPAQDRQRANEFVAKAREKQSIAIDPKNRNRASLVVGDADWPFPVPIVKRGAKWTFDTAAGRQEILHRRIGANELDAIAISRGYVEAQHEYALKAREGYEVHQYAQRIISTPGKQDGLAWQKPDGTWDGPVGERVARAIVQGYSKRGEPYHGYYFKVLTGQGPAAPLGQLDYVIKGAMIGGFALAAVPAEYGVTGIKTFIVSQDGVVYQKDLGAATATTFAAMSRFNPDKSWEPVPGE